MKSQSHATSGVEALATITPQVQKLIEELLIIKNDSYYDVRSACCLALGKIGQNTPEIRDSLVESLNDKNEEVRQSAVLALGMIKATEAREQVVKILTSNANRGSDPDGLRAFAAVSLGLMGLENNLDILRSVALDANVRDEIRAGAIMGLGLLGDGRGAATLLCIVLGGFKPESTAFAIASLAATGKAEIVIGSGSGTKTVNVVELLENRLANKTFEDQVRRAAALALGTVGRAYSSLQVLEHAFRFDSDKGVKCFSLLSLARIASMLPTGDPAKLEVRSFVRTVLETERDATIRGFAATAAGLSKDQEIGSFLLEVFRSGEAPDVRAAAAISLGMIRYRPAISDLAIEVEKPRSGGDARGLSCVAMGMIGDPAAVEYLRSVLRDVNVPYLKWMAAAGLGIMRDRGCLDDLYALAGDRNRIVREGAIRAIRCYRDEDSMENLLRAFQRETVNEVRALIIVSLGTIAGRDDTLSALRKMTENINWIAAVRMNSIDLLTRLF